MNSHMNSGVPRFQMLLVAYLAATGPELQGDQKLVDEGFKGRERLQVDGRKRRQGTRLEMLMHD